MAAPQNEKKKALELALSQIEKNFGKGSIMKMNEGKKIPIGGIESRHFRLLRSLCEPNFGIHKTLDTVFEAIRLPKDSKDSRLNDVALKRLRVMEIIGYAVKELQKNEELQGKLKYKYNDAKTQMWVELEG